MPTKELREDFFAFDGMGPKKWEKLLEYTGTQDGINDNTRFMDGVGKLMKGPKNALRDLLRRNEYLLGSIRTNYQAGVYTPLQPSQTLSTPYVPYREPAVIDVDDGRTSFRHSE